MTLVTDVCGLDPKRDDTRHVLATAKALADFIHCTSATFADHIAGLKRAYPDHDLNHLGPEYLGVGYALTLRAPDDSELHVGVSPAQWALGGPGDEAPARDTYRPETGWAHVEHWLAAHAGDSDG